MLKIKIPISIENNNPLHIDILYDMSNLLFYKNQLEELLENNPLRRLLISLKVCNQKSTDKLLYLPLRGEVLLINKDNMRIIQSKAFTERLFKGLSSFNPQKHNSLYVNVYGSSEFPTFIFYPVYNEIL